MRTRPSSEAEQHQEEPTVRFDCREPDLLPTPWRVREVQDVVRVRGDGDRVVEELDLAGGELRRRLPIRRAPERDFVGPQEGLLRAGVSALGAPEGGLAPAAAGVDSTRLDSRNHPRSRRPPRARPCTGRSTPRTACWRCTAAEKRVSTSMPVLSFPSPAPRGRTWYGFTLRMTAASAAAHSSLSRTTRRSPPCMYTVSNPAPAWPAHRNSNVKMGSMYAKSSGSGSSRTAARASASFRAGLMPLMEPQRPDALSSRSHRFWRLLDSRTYCCFWERAPTQADAC